MTKRATTQHFLKIPESIDAALDAIYNSRSSLCPGYYLPSIVTMDVAGSAGCCRHKSLFLSWVAPMDAFRNGARRIRKSRKGMADVCFGKMHYSQPGLEVALIDSGLRSQLMICCWYSTVHVHQSSLVEKPFCLLPLPLHHLFSCPYFLPTRNSLFINLHRFLPLHLGCYHPNVRHT